MNASKESLCSFIHSVLSLFSTVALVYLFTYMGNSSGDPIIVPQEISYSLGNAFCVLWWFIAAVLGLLVACMTVGSTVSILTCSPVQYDIAQATGMSVPMILTLQVIGAGAGNMICVHNVVAASTVVGLSGKEGSIIRKTILPAILYGLMTGIGAYILLLFM